MRFISVTWLTVLAAGALCAQSSRSANPLYFAVVSHIPYGDANAVLVRRPGGEQRDLVLIRRDALSPELAAGAMQVARTARAFQGESVKTQLVMRVRPSHASASEVANGQALVERLKNAPQQEVSGAGPAPMIEVAMPHIRRNPRRVDARRGMR